MPAEFGELRQQRLDFLQADAVLVIRLAVAAKFIGAQAAHTGGMPLLEDRGCELGAADRHAAQPLWLAHQRIEHRRIVAAIGGRLHQHAALEAEPVEQRQVRGERCVVRRIAARLRIRKPRRRTEDVAMAVAGALQKRAAHFGTMWASLAASPMCSYSVLM